MRSTSYLSSLLMVTLSISFTIALQEINLPDLLPLPPELISQAPSPLLLKRRTIATNITLPFPPSPPPRIPPTPTPQPLDTSISYSLSTNCLLYLTSLLSSTTFQTCLPLSLLLTTSTAYSTLISKSTSSGNYTTLNNLLAYTSNPSSSAGTCETYMSGVLVALKQRENCGNDLGNGNSVAREAQMGVGNYAVVRKAGELVDPDTGVYCYLQAVASLEPDELYLWGLASGISLPPKFQPTCSKCSALLVNTYITSIPTTQTLNSTLIKSAVSTINTKCGSNFTTYNVATSSASRLSLGWMSVGPAVVVVVGATIGVWMNGFGMG